MNTPKFNINDPGSKQIFINLRLAGFNLNDISTAIGASYSTTKRIYEELRPEIHTQMLKNKQQKSHSLTDKVDAFLASLEKHFYIIDEAMIGSYGRMNYEEYIASMLKFTNAYEKLVKLRILLASSQSLLKSPNEPFDPQNGSTENKESAENVLQSSLIAEKKEKETKNSNEPCDPQNGSNENLESAENVLQSSLLADESENVLQSSLIADESENVLQPSLVAETKKPNEPRDPQNGSNENIELKENSENVLQPSLVAAKSKNVLQSSLIADESENVLQSSLIAETKNPNEPCDTQKGSNKNTENERKDNKSKINKESISYYKYRKQKLSEMKKQNETIKNNSSN